MANVEQMDTLDLLEGEGETARQPFSPKDTRSPPATRPM
jgi:hypothetical protein